jgi:hypothetical protein
MVIMLNSSILTAFSAVFSRFFHSSINQYLISNILPILIEKYMYHGSTDALYANNGVGFVQRENFLTLFGGGNNVPNLNQNNPLLTSPNPHTTPEPGDTYNLSSLLSQLPPFNITALPSNLNTPMPTYILSSYFAPILESMLPSPVPPLYTPSQCTREGHYASLTQTYPISVEPIPSSSGYISKKAKKLALEKAAMRQAAQNMINNNINNINPNALTQISTAHLPTHRFESLIITALFHLLPIHSTPLLIQLTQSYLLEYFSNHITLTMEAINIGILTQPTNYLKNSLQYALRHSYSHLLSTTDLLQHTRFSADPLDDDLAFFSGQGKEKRRKKTMLGLLAGRLSDFYPYSVPSVADLSPYRHVLVGKPPKPPARRLKDTNSMLPGEIVEEDRGIEKVMVGGVFNANFGNYGGFGALIKPGFFEQRNGFILARMNNMGKTAHFDLRSDQLQLYDNGDGDGGNDAYLGSDCHVESVQHDQNGQNGQIGQIGDNTTHFSEEIAYSFVGNDMVPNGVQDEQHSSGTVPNYHYPRQEIRQDAGNQATQGRVDNTMSDMP